MQTDDLIDHIQNHNSKSQEKEAFNFKGKLLPETSVVSDALKSDAYEFAV